MSNRAAIRYAKAVLELASETHQEDAVYSDMQNIADSISGSKELQQLLKSPILENSLKKKAILTIFIKHTEVLTQKLFNLLEENKRLTLLQLVAFQYQVLYNNQKGIVKAVVTSAVALDEQMTKKVLHKAEEIIGLGKKINLENKIDPSLIGGFVLRIGDVQIDTSIVTQLKKLKRELVENN